MTFIETTQLLANMGDFVGAVVIVITLLYLARQVSQNTKALHAQSRQAALSAGHAELLAIVEHPEIHLAQISAEPLTAEEHIKLSHWLLVVMRSREFAWLQYRNGAIDELQWALEVLVIQNVLSNYCNRAWWDSLGRLVFPGEFVAFVDNIIGQQAATNDVSLLMTTWSNGLDFKKGRVKT
jgi:hypothetical protein